MSMKDVCEEINSLIEKSDNALTKHTTGTSIKDAISVALVSIAKQHHSMILKATLVHNQVNSAFALMRPLVEATYRAIWIMVVANEEQAKEIGNDTKRFPSSPRPLAIEIDNKESGVVYQTRFDQNKHLLNGFTHGGIELIARQNSGNSVHPDFTEEELVALLTESTMTYGILLFNYGKYIKDDELSKLGGQMVKDINLIKVLKK